VLHDNGDLDRLSLASPLLGATGWIDGLAQLVAIDTGKGGDEADREFAGVLQDMFAPLGLSFRRLQIPSATPGLPAVAMMAARRTGRRTCTFYFHTHTLPAGEGWARPAFGLSRQGSRLYGRGTTEMKGAIAAVWAALRAADAVGLGLGFDPVLIFCADPPNGQHEALRHLAAQGLVEGHVVYLSGATMPRVWTASPGSVHLSIALQVVDPAVRPAANPIEASGPVMSRLAELRAAIALRGQGATLSEPCTEDAGCGDGLSVASIRGGIVGGSAPQICYISVDRTYRPPEDVSGIVAEVETAVLSGLEGVAGIAATMRVVGSAPPVTGADQGPHGGRWRKALSWGFGFPESGFRPWSGPLTSPMGIVQQAGVQEILLAGLRRPGTSIGCPDEFTTVEDVEALARSVLAYLSDVSDLPTY
jgi:succinyl-diaminopimelate desuccinylase